METAYADARKNIDASHKRQKRLYDQRQHGGSYKVSDLVWFYNPRRVKGITTKLSCNWVGPYLIIKKLSDTVFRIQRSRGSKPKVVHYDRLKPYHGDAQRWTVSETVPVEDISQTDSSDTDSDTDVVPNLSGRNKRVTKVPQRFTPH